MGHSKRVENPVVCEGSHFEMGVAQGTQLRGLIVNLSRDIRNLEAFQLLRPKWMPYGLYLEIAKFQAKRTFRKLDRDYPDYVERLRGIAQGSGQGVSIICLLNIFESILSDLTETTDVAPLGGCSAVALRGTKVESGGAVIARNFDYLPLIQPYYSLRQCRPKNGFRSLEFLAAPLGGCIDGLNEKGLCITLNYAYVTDKSDLAPPITYAIAKAIATCTNVDEAVQVISNTPRWGGGLVMLADASGEVASLELSNTKATVRKPENGEDFLFHTNVFNCQEMKAVELDQNSRYSEKAPTALRGECVGESAEERRERLGDLISRKQEFSVPQDLNDLMADHGANNDPSANSVCMHSDYWFTTATMQYYPKRLRARISYSPACEANYEEFEV